MAAAPAKWTEIAFVEVQDADGQIARARGDKQKAQAAFAPARKKMDAQQGDKPC